MTFHKGIDTCQTFWSDTYMEVYETFLGTDSYELWSGDTPCDVVKCKGHISDTGSDGYPPQRLRNDQSGKGTQSSPLQAPRPTKRKQNRSAVQTCYKCVRQQVYLTCPTFFLSLVDVQQATGTPLTPVMSDMVTTPFSNNTYPMHTSCTSP